MKSANQLKLAAIAAAVAAAFATPAGAQTQIIGAGASAINNSLKGLVLVDYCFLGGATDTTVYDNGTANNGSGNGGIYRIKCTPSSSASKFTAGVDISYDTAGGSWKGLISTNSALQSLAQSTANANPVSTIDLGQACGGTSSNSVSLSSGGTAFSVPVTLNFGCHLSSVSVGSTVTFGFTDVDESLFNGSTANQPLQNGTWLTAPSNIYTAKHGQAWSVGVSEGSGTPYAAFGVVFGVAASSPLYAAMQTDQVSAGLLAPTCGGVAWTAGGNACTPNITRSQYRSLVGGAGTFTTTNAGLFTTVFPTDTSIELARRDQGSGTQGGSNAYFLDVGCSTNTDLTPILPVNATSTLLVTYNAATGNVIGRLTNTSAGGPSNYVIGIVSAENDSSGKLVTTSGSAGFLKLDGVYPSNTNAYNGSYGYVTTENFHCAGGLAGDSNTFCLDMTGQNTTNGVPTQDTLAGYTNTGIVQFSNASNHYSNNNHVCSGWRHL